ncbi:hypothetical protein V8G54_001324 [Vigna mungo]|uniref:Uncharacterized protein n=1 Tax=Vigna mungo TaxID=3915 RepID=A0AAQ3P817_VIGMU
MTSSPSSTTAKQTPTSERKPLFSHKPSTHLSVSSCTEVSTLCISWKDLSRLLAFTVIRPSFWTVALYKRKTPNHLTGDISGLGPFELDALQDWEYKFMSKYVKVGTVKSELPVTESKSTVEPSETTSRDIDTASTVKPKMANQKLVLLKVKKPLQTLMQKNRTLILEKKSRVAEFDMPTRLLEDKSSMFLKLVTDHILVDSFVGEASNGQPSRESDIEMGQVPRSNSDMGMEAFNKQMDKLAVLLQKLKNLSNRQKPGCEKGTCKNEYDKTLRQRIQDEYYCIVKT